MPSQESSTPGSANQPQQPLTDPNATAFLHAAVAGQQEEAGRLLAELQPESRANLFVASMLGDAERVEAMLERDPTAARQKGGPKDWDPLLYVSFSRFHQDNPDRAQGIVRVAKALLARGANPNTYYLWDGDGKSKLPALWAAACEANHPALVRLLLEAGANPNDGETIYHAAEHNHRECLEVLREFGVKLNGPIQPWNNTPIYFLLGHNPATAPAVNAFAGIAWLLEHGADPNIASYKIEGRPIHLAAGKGWGVEMFDLLLRHGADLHIRRKDGRNAYALAVINGQTHAADWLRQHGVDTALNAGDEFLAACGRGDEAAVKALLAREPDLVASMPDAEKQTIGHAASNDKAEAVRLMLKAGVPVDLRGHGGETALHMAAWHGHIATVKVILSFGPSLEIADTNYHATPLGWACHGSLNCGNPKGDYGAVVQALLAAGAVPSPDHAGSKAVEEALDPARKAGAAS